MSTVMYGAGISAARFPTPAQVERVLREYNDQATSATIAKLESRIADLEAELAALTKRTRRKVRRHK